MMKVRNDISKYVSAVAGNNPYDLLHVDCDAADTDREEDQGGVVKRYLRSKARVRLGNLSGAYVRCFIRAMKDIIEDFGEAMVHEHSRDSESAEVPQIYIPCGLFRDRTDLCRYLINTQQVPPQRRVNYLMSLWQKHFPHVAIKKWIPFAKCEQCCRLRDALFMTRCSRCASDAIQIYVNQCAIGTRRKGVSYVNSSGRTDSTSH